MNALRLSLCAIIPISAAVRINIGGALSPGEVILVLISPFLLKEISEIWNIRWVRIIFYFLAAIIFWQIAVDFYRQIPLLDRLRGTARIGMIAFSFLVIGALIGGDRRRIFAFIIGAALASVVAASLQEDTLERLTSAYGYKFVVGSLISILSFVVMGYSPKRLRKLALFAPLAAGIFALTMNSRSLAGTTLLAWFVILFIHSRRGPGSIFTLPRVASYLGIILAAIAIMFAYTYLAPRGVLGDEAKAKFEKQEGSSEGEFSVFSGRSELHFSWPKISESPIIGWGSWAKNRTYVYGKLLDLGMPQKQAAGLVARKNGLIPAHSHLFGAWLENGLLGACFWMMVLFLVARILILDGFQCFGRMRPLLIYLFVTWLWHILFSPLGGARRVETGVMLWIVVLTNLHLSQLTTKLKSVRKVHRPVLSLSHD